MAEQLVEEVVDWGNFGLPASAVAALRGVFAQNAHVDRAVVFGSRARGNYRAGSDIDIALEGCGLASSDLMHLETALDDLLLPWKIDISLISQIDNPELLAHIARVGKPLWVRQDKQDSSPAQVNA